MNLIFIEHSIQKQNTHSSQVHMEHSSKLITYWVTKQSMVNLRRLKSYQVSYQLQCYQIRNQSQKEKKNGKKSTSMWRLNNMLLNDHGSLEKSKKKKYVETNDNENTMIQNL